MKLVLGVITVLSLDKELVARSQGYLGSLDILTVNVVPFGWFRENIPESLIFRSVPVHLVLSI